ncbi:MAG: hypothetical protein KatS3mg109_1777 [Pirellulaceae bacterium]|nr:MAG: hypothetical protein KatS3mg109_1777 [Pirellulaceae bacterium]
MPSDAAQFASRFYDFEFGPFAAPGTRALLSGSGRRQPEDRAINLLAEGSVAALAVPRPDGGLPLKQDDELARVVARGAHCLFNRGLSGRSWSLCTRFPVSCARRSSTSRPADSA